MASVFSELSVAKLERILNQRKSALVALTSRRDKIQKALQKIELRIQGLEGRASGRDGIKRRRKRPKNGKSLATVVEEILARNKNGLSLGDLTDKILATGYKSSSSNFKNVLYQCLYHSETIQHSAKTGNYRLK